MIPSNARSHFSDEIEVTKCSGILPVVIQMQKIVIDLKKIYMVTTEMEIMYVKLCLSFAPTRAG